MVKTILAADIGGTNSRFAQFTASTDSGLELIETRWLTTAKAESFTQLLEQLLRVSEFTLLPEKADIAVIAAAGPVEDNSSCAPPYISWDIDLSMDQPGRLPKATFLLNDFVAQAYACRFQIVDSARLVLSGEPVADAAIGVRSGNRTWKSHSYASP